MCCRNILRQTINVELKIPSCVYSFFVVNSDTNKYKNKSANGEAQFVSMGIPTDCWKTSKSQRRLSVVQKSFKCQLQSVCVCVCIIIMVYNKNNLQI